MYRNSVLGCGKTVGGLFGLRKNPGRASLAVEKPWADYFGCGRTVGGLFGQRKNPGRIILGTEKPWAGYFGCGKTWAGAILAAEKTIRARTFWKFDIQTLYF